MRTYWVSTLIFALLLLGNQQQTVAAQPEPPPRPRTQTTRLLDACYDNFSQGNYEAARQACLAALPRLQTTSERARRARVIHELGLIHDRLTDYEAALDYYQQALKLQRQLNEVGNEAWTLNNIGVVYHNQGNYTQALDYYQQALTLWPQTADRFGEGNTLNNMGRVYRSLQQYDQALAHLEQATAIWAEIAETWKAAETAQDIGLVYYDSGDYAQALIYGQQALEAWQTLADKPQEAHARLNVGLALGNLDDWTKARDHFEQALVIYEALDNQGQAAWALNNIGWAYDNENNLAQARAFYEQALAKWETLNDAVGLATTLRNLGLIAHAQGDSDEAITYHQRALDIWLEAEDKAKAAHAHNDLAQVYQALNRPGQALTHFQASLRLGETLDDPQTTAWTLNNIGIVYQNLGDHTNARDYYQQALQHYEAADDQGGMAIVLVNIGVVHQAQNEYDQAQAAYEEALAIQEEIDDSAGLAWASYNLGALAAAQSDHQQALAYYQRAVKLWHAVENRVGEAGSLMGIGQAQLALAAYQPALIAYQDALTLWRALKNPFQEAQTLSQIGLVYGLLNDPIQSITYSKAAVALAEQILAADADSTTQTQRQADLAAYDAPLAAQMAQNQATVRQTLERMIAIAKPLLAAMETAAQTGQLPRAYSVAELDQLEQVVKTVQSMGNRAVEAQGWLALGTGRLQLQDYAGALAAYKQALELWYTLNNRASEALTLHQMGLVYLGQADGEQALTHFQQALLIRRAIGDRAGEATTLFSVAGVYDTRGEIDMALAQIEAAIDIVEQISGELRAETLQSAFAGSANGYYLYAVQLLLKSGRDAEAFAYAERSRARALLTLLGNQPLRAKRSEDPALLVREAELRAERNELEEQLRTAWTANNGAPDQPAIDRLTGEIERARQAYETLLGELQLTNPAYAALVSVAPFRSQEAQTMLATQAPDVTLLAYLVSVQETFIFVIGAETFHVERVAVSATELRQHVEALRAQMKTGLLAPDAWQAPAQALHQWLIAPVQKYLPPPNPATPARLGIIPHDVLHYLPFGLLHAQDEGREQRMLLEDYTLFAAPSVSALQFVLSADPIPSGNAARLLALANPTANGLPYLYHAEAEAAAIATLYATQPITATEGTFKRQAGAFDLIHIAAHSDYNVQSPLFSALLLTADAGEDGRLETHEIFDLDLAQTDLVVLSACETHAGSLGRGDELVGLEQAFLRAGAPSLVTTLWPVDDIATAVFMRHFYLKLRSGLPAAVALQQAQLATHSEFSDPYFWAGFILVGNGG